MPRTFRRDRQGMVTTIALVPTLLPPANNTVPLTEGCLYLTKQKKTYHSQHDMVTLCNSMVLEHICSFLAPPPFLIVPDRKDKIHRYLTAAVFPRAEELYKENMLISNQEKAYPVRDQPELPTSPENITAKILFSFIFATFRYPLIEQCLFALLTPTIFSPVQLQVGLL